MYYIMIVNSDEIYVNCFPNTNSTVFILMDIERTYIMCFRTDYITRDLVAYQ